MWSSRRSALDLQIQSQEGPLKVPNTDVISGGGETDQVWVGQYNHIY